MLRLQGVDTFYGPSQVLHDVSLEVNQGEIVCLLGANAAGKTTTMKTIFGLVHPRHGTIEFEGQPIQQRLPGDIVRLGMALVPEARRIFPRMTVMENLEMGAFIRNNRAEVMEDMDHVFQLFPRLSERLEQRAETLSGGEQQMLAIGRALMTRPRLLMLDEPSQGIMPKLVDEIFQAVKRIRDAGMTVLIVEQRMTECLEIADRAYILQTGRVLMQGAASEIMGNPDVRKAYLGL